MSANFYKAGGVNFMLGCDWHTFLMLNPVPQLAAIPVPEPRHPHPVGALLWAPDASTSKVTIEGSLIWQEDGAQMAAHIPWPSKPPHWSEPLMVALINITSQTTAYLAVESVHGEGEPLACCFGECVGTNGNCGDIPEPNFVVCVTSVKTNPTFRDYVRAILAAAFDWAIGKLLEKASKGLGLKPNKAAKELEKILFEKIFKPFVDWVIVKALDPILKGIRDGIRGIVTAHTTEIA